MRLPLPPQRPPTEVTRLEDVYQPTTREERIGLANAYAMRDVNRGIRRIVRHLDHRLDALEKRRQARERFGPR